MRRPILCAALFALGISVLPAQLIVTTVAGGKIQSGVAAKDVVVGVAGSLARDTKGNIVFADGTAIRRIRPDGITETIAGTEMGGYGGDGGPASSARIQGASALKYDSAGNLYIVDVNNYRIRKIDTSGIITTVAGTGIRGSLGSDGSAVNAQVERISDLAIDNNSNVYFAESVGPSSWNRIRRLTPAGRIELVAGIEPSCFNCESGGDGGPATKATFSYNAPLLLGIDGSGNLYVSDADHLRRITPGGIIDKFAFYGAGQFVDGSQALNTSIEGNFISSLTVDASNSVFLATTTPAILRITSDGVAHTVAARGNGADGPATKALFTTVRGLLADGSGNLYFADANRIRQLDSLGSVQTIAGGSPKAAPDGTLATDAWLVNPTAITISRSGELFIFELGTCSLRKVGGDGRLSTVAGTGKCSLTNVSGAAAGTDLPRTIRLAIDSQNRIYGGPDLVTLAVYAVSPTGEITTVPASSGPAVVAVDSKDRLYYGNQTGSVIFRTAPGGIAESLSWLFGFRPQPSVGAIALDSSDNVYILASGPPVNFPILRFDQAGQPTTLGTAFSIGSSNARAAIAADPAAGVWYTDGQSLNKLPNVSGAPLAQFGFPSGDGGPAVASFFSGPSSLTFAPNGDLYILDQGSSGRVRKISGTAPKTAPAINQGGVVNAASLVSGPIAPGELISIYGSNFGPISLLIATPQNNALPKSLGSTRVFFNGTAGAITAATANQINVFVPYGLSGTTANLIVNVDGVESTPVAVPLAASAIGFVSADASGTGQGAILNQDGSYNGPANPAPAGSVISLFGTGEGPISPALPDGALVISTPTSTPVASPISATIGGQKADVLYAGSAPTLPAGVFQVNLRIPAGLAPGNAPISVTVGSSSTTRQITCAVK